MLNTNMRSMYYLTAHIQKQVPWFVYKKFKHNKSDICTFNAKSGFSIFFKNSFLCSAWCWKVTAYTCSFFYEKIIWSWEIIKIILLWQMRSNTLHCMTMTKC